MLHELQHGTARWKQVGIRRASGLGSRALKQHVHFIPQCAMVTTWDPVGLLYRSVDVYFALSVALQQAQQQL